MYPSEGLLANCPMAGRDKESLGMPCFRAIISKSFSFKTEGLRSEGSSIIVDGVYCTRALLLWGLSCDEMLSDSDEYSESWAVVEGPSASASVVEALDDWLVTTIFLLFF